MRSRLKGAIAGLVSAGFGIAVAELLAAAARPQAAPLVVVGGAVIDRTPVAIKEFAVRELGTNDKPVLLGSIVLVLALFAAATGVAATWRRILIVPGAAVLGGTGVAAALSRPAASPLDVIPTLLGASLAGATLWFLLRRLSPELRRPAPDLSSPAAPVAGEPMLAAEPEVVQFDRRSFLKAAALVAGGAVVAQGGAVLVGRAGGDPRDAVRLPAPADPAGAAPSLVTANGQFYRVDTALTVPRIDLDTWSLRIHGMVDREVRLSFDDLLRRPLIERYVTLNCVSNEVGGPYVGTARWLGVRLSDLLTEAGVHADADQIVARSTEGMTIGTPVATALDGRDTMLVVGMNGQPLPLEHGFPVRMLTPGLYGYAGACKWLSEIELTRFDQFDAYWVKRGYAAQGVVKTASRIDRPKPFAQLAAGVVTVAGVAWAQRRGIKAVEVSVDGGAWSRAELLPTASVDTWVQWRYAWRATAGPHSIAVRATDGTGAVQTSQRVGTFPSGATGWHTITVTVG